MCKNRKKYTTAKMAGEFIGICSRTFKSFLFNILVFGLGFAACYVYAVQKINRQATEYSIPCSIAASACLNDIPTSLDSSLNRFKISVFLGAHKTNNCAIIHQIH